MSGIKVVVPSATEPVTALECWRHLRLDGAYDSPPPDTVTEAGMIALYLAAAREYAEQFTNLSLAPQTLELSLNGFPVDEIELTRGPVQSVVSITYVDEDGNPQVVDSGDYALDNYSRTAWVLPTVGIAWPTALGVVNAVKVRYIAGYALAGDSPQDFPLPATIRAAILLLTGDLYENRENTIVDGRVVVQQVSFGVHALLMPHRVGLGA